MQLYHHKTDGGAEYLTSAYIVAPNGEKEGSFKLSKYIVRIDGDITKDAELLIKEDEETLPVPRVNVYNMTSPRGNREVPNQFVIETKDGAYFKSYRSIIAFRPYAGKFGGKIVLDESKWDYSTTTGKYRNDFLGEGIEETRKKIKSGEYILGDLN